MRKRDKVFLLFCFVLVASPILFGARHPLIQGFFASLLMLSGGIWIIFHFDKIRANFSVMMVIPLVIIGFIFFSSIPLPFFLIRVLSPVRADYLATGLEIGRLENITTTLSYYAPDTFFQGMFLLALLLYFLAVSNMFDRKDQRKTVLWLITLVGFTEAGYGLLQAMNPALGVLWLPSQIGAEESARGTIIYRNQYAALLNMCWPMSLVLGIMLYRPLLDRYPACKKNSRPSFAARISLLFQKAALPFWACGFMILAIIFSRSRGGIIVMLAVAILLIALLPFSRKIKGLVSGFFAAFILLYGGLIGFHGVAARFMEFYQGALGRFGLWLDSLSILRDHLLTGIGMGGYKLLSLVYLKNVPDQAWFDFAHNEYVETAIELGLPVMILLMIWIFRGLGGFLVLQQQNQENAVLAIGAYCGLIGLLLHGLVDFIWRLPVNAIYAVTLLALLSNVSRGKKAHDR